MDARLFNGTILKPSKRTPKKDETITTPNTDTSETTKVLGVAKVTFAPDEPKMVQRDSSSLANHSESTSSTQPVQVLIERTVNNVQTFEWCNMNGWNRLVPINHLRRVGVRPWYPTVLEFM